MGYELVDISVILTLENFKILFEGAKISLIIATISCISGIIIGIFIAFFKLSKNKFLKTFGSIYVDLIRGTPMLLQILFLFLGVPVIYKMIFGTVLRVNIYVCGCVALSINSGAYTAELIRSSIISIKKGQAEAGKTLGLSKNQVMRYIILPQAIRRVVAPIASEYITLIKDSSLLGTIGVIELLQAAKLIGATYYNYLIPLIMASIFYLLMTIVISYISHIIEKKVTL